jgi:cob(I)alamin adenosyltransferase
MQEFSAAQVTINQNGLKVGENNPLPVTLSGSGSSGASTSDNQVTIIAQLDDVLTALNTDTEDKRLTVRLDEVSDTLFYVGNQIQLATDAPQLQENNDKLDELILKIDTQKDPLTLPQFIALK